MSDRKSAPDQQRRKGQNSTGNGQRSRRGWRGFRPWEKKRGSRQTGSSRWGAAGETLLFSALFLGGIILLTELVSLRVIWNTDSFLTSNLGLVLSVLLLGSLIVGGAAGAIYNVFQTGTSAERRAAIAKRATDNELLAEVQPAKEHALPAIPDDANWRNSPGIRLAYRLPAASSQSWRLVIAACFCLLWNGAVAVLAVLALNQGDDFKIGSLLSREWWTVFRIVVLLYGIIGLLSIRYVLRQLVTAAAIGPTGIEVSAMPLVPGDEYRVFLSQSGHLHIDWIELVLTCDEEVSFSDGTDTRTETRRVHEECLFRHEAFEILPSQPFHCDCPMDIPSDAMHSFVAANNAVTWKLMVRLQPRLWDKQSKSKLPWSKFIRAIKARFRRGKKNKKSWPIVERVYPLVLHPNFEPKLEQSV